tara:strand:+ start:1382 stop:2014 length:633 start_codon:yes stop_codon:yes gene_type:complete
MINLNLTTNQILTQNSKLKKTSKLNNKRVFNFGIIANKSLEGKSTCPFAKGCLGADYKCYAQKGAYSWPKVKEAYNNRYHLTLQDSFVNIMNQAIQKKKVDILRLHDSGDFYSPAYLNKWIDIANNNKEVIFYAYTKSIPFFKKNLDIPTNLKIIFSEGSKKDNLINTTKDRHSRIFKDINSMLKAGYINASDNDLNAIQDNKKVGLLLH